MNFKKLADKAQCDYNDPIVLAAQNNKIHELADEVLSDENITYLTIRDKQGFDAYVKSMTFLMIKSFYKVVGKENIDRLEVLFSVGDNLYIEADGNFALTQELLDEIKEKIIYFVNKNLPLVKTTISKEEALKLFHEYKMFDKEKLFKYRRVSTVSIYSIGHFSDYFYGDMVYSTSILKCFDLQVYKDGFLLRLPNIKNPYVLDAIPNMDKLYQVLKESYNTSKNIGIRTVADLNDAIVSKRIDDVILLQESMMEHKIGHIAEEIALNKNIKFVMISGPSSSGKTTFSHRLSIQLQTLGIKPHPISADDYFVNRADIKPDKNGKVDLESIDVVDVEQFNKDMLALLKGETVYMPTYNFLKGEREYTGKTITLGDNDVLIVEGIHCLNDKMSYSLSNENKYRIYISALTQLRIDEHNRVSSSDLRMIRRMCRDERTRGISAKATIDMWTSVRDGEKKNIFPYQENADVVINSGIIYELLILKQIIEPLLFAIDTSEPEYAEAKRLLKFLDFFLSYNDKTVPVNSLLKEFIGGGYFKV